MSTNHISRSQLVTETWEELLGGIGLNSFKKKSKAILEELIKEYDLSIRDVTYGEGRQRRYQIPVKHADKVKEFLKHFWRQDYTASDVSRVMNGELEMNDFEKLMEGFEELIEDPDYKDNLEELKKKRKRIAELKKESQDLQQQSYEILKNELNPSNVLR